MIACHTGSKEMESYLADVVAADGGPREALAGGLQFMKVSLALGIHSVNSFRAFLQHHVAVEDTVAAIQVSLLAFKFNMLFHSGIKSSSMSHARLREGDVP